MLYCRSSIKGTSTKKRGTWNSYDFFPCNFPWNYPKSSWHDWKKEEIFKNISRKRYTQVGFEYTHAKAIHFYNRNSVNNVVRLCLVMFLKINLSAYCEWDSSFVAKITQTHTFTFHRIETHFHSVSNDPFKVLYICILYSLN